MGLEVFDYEGVLGAPEEAITWLVPTLIPAPSRVLLHGSRATFKSFLVLQLCLDLAAGASVWGAFPPLPSVRTLLFQGEGGRPQWFKRVREMARYYSAALPFWTVHSLQTKLNSAAGLKEATAIVKFVAPQLIAVDPAFKWFSGRENEAYEVQSWLDVLDGWVEEYKSTGLLVHHNRQQQRDFVPGEGSRVVDAGMDEARGSSKLPDWADVAITTKKQDGGVLLKPLKMRDDETPPAMKFRFEAGHMVLSHRADSDDTRLLSILKETGTLTLAGFMERVVKETSFSESTVRRMLERLANAGKLTLYNKGKRQIIAPLDAEVGEENED